MSTIYKSFTVPVVAGALALEAIHGEGKPHPDGNYRTAPIFAPQVAGVTSSSMSVSAVSFGRW